jgi:hypothetical protein
MICRKSVKTFTKSSFWLVRALFVFVIKGIRFHRKSLPPKYLGGRGFGRKVVVFNEKGRFPNFREVEVLAEESMFSLNYYVMSEVSKSLRQKLFFVI